MTPIIFVRALEVVGLIIKISWMLLFRFLVPSLGFSPGIHYVKPVRTPREETPGTNTPHLILPLLPCLAGPSHRLNPPEGRDKKPDDVIYPVSPLGRAEEGWRVDPEEDVQLPC